ncbi:MAG: energy transducer TonB [Acidobacteriota bacterium]|nr:energy transducer TonB [Acidobacteriota bacterium]
MKAAYQLYDLESKPTSQGTYEHCWVSPKVHRNSWNRPGAVHSDWHTADGKHAIHDEGSLEYFEYALQSSLLTPLPNQAELDPPNHRLERQDLKIGGIKLDCIKVIPKMPLNGHLQIVPLGLFPTYCFDEGSPILRIEYSWGSLGIEYNKIVKVQDHYLPREITIFGGKRKILTASVDVIEGITTSAPVLTPPPNATTVTTDKVQLTSEISNGMNLKTVVPIYPQDAKDAQVSGRVVLRGIIGPDGVVHDLQIVETPWPSLAASALWSVSQWHYKPYLLNGEPVEVETTFNVIYTLG